MIGKLDYWQTLEISLHLAPDFDPGLSLWKCFVGNSGLSREHGALPVKSTILHVNVKRPIFSTASRLADQRLDEVSIARLALLVSTMPHRAILDHSGGFVYKIVYILTLNALIGRHHPSCD